VKPPRRQRKYATHSANLPTEFGGDQLRNKYDWGWATNRKSKLFHGRALGGALKHQVWAGVQVVSRLMWKM